MAKKILIVDDESDLLMLLVFRLEKLGHEVTTATNGQEALDLIQKEKPDLIFLDLLLPVIDGCEVCRRIKTDEELKRISVVFLTANSIGVDEKVKKCDADDFLLKPFESKELLDKIKKFLG